MKKKDLFREELAAEYTKMWTRDGVVDQHMVDHCLGEVTDVVRLECGLYIVTAKRKIKTRFPVPEGRAQDMQEALKQCDLIRRSEQHFLDANLGPLREELEMTRSAEHIYCGHRNSRSDIGALSLKRGWSGNDESWQEITRMDREYLIQMQEREIEAFEKKLRTYLGRWGLSKIRTWTYWDEE